MKGLAMKIKDGIISDCTIQISNTTKVPDSYGVQTSNNFTVDFDGCTVAQLLDWVKKAWWIDDQKVIRKMSVDDVHGLNGTVVEWTHAKTKFTTVSEEQAKSITIRTYQGLIKAGEFKKAEAFLKEITGESNEVEQEDEVEEERLEDTL